MYEGRNAKYYYQITDKKTGEIKKEGYVTGGSKSDCENAAFLIKLDVSRQMGLSAASDEDRERLKVYLHRADDGGILELRNSTGLSRTAFAKRYSIPYRTLEDWEAGKRTPPSWVRALIEKAIKFDGLA